MERPLNGAEQAAAKMEPEATVGATGGLTRQKLAAELAPVSIAISLKRIADAIDGLILRPERRG